MSTFLKNIKKPLLLSAVMLLLCGFIFPLILTGIGQLLFPYQANGSLVRNSQGQVVGSTLVGQNFTDPRFMKGRPSAVNYNTYSREDIESGNYSGLRSGSANYAASNPALVSRVKADIEVFLLANPSIKQEDIPADLLTASGSGLDPHISPASAAIQIPALVESTGLSEEALQLIVQKHTQEKLFGILGEETVNVLMVNLDIAKELK